MVVEITPIGIETLHWRFYIIWAVFNAAFVPIVYFFYPETAGRKLEDCFFRENQDILIHRDPEATSNKRPQRYIDDEAAHHRRKSSINPAAARKSKPKLDVDDRRASVWHYEDDEGGLLGEEKALGARVEETVDWTPTSDTNGDVERGVSPGRRTWGNLR